MSAIAVAVIGAAIIGGGVSYYQAEEQRKSSEDAQRKVDAENARQRAEADRIARETRPEGETVGDAIKFGTMSDETDATSDFLVNKQTIGKSTSGLNTGNQTGGLGFVL